MKHLLAPLSLTIAAAGILLSTGCAQITAAEHMACQAAAKLPPQARLALDAQDPNSFEGIYWAATKMACHL